MNRRKEINKFIKENSNSHIDEDFKKKFFELDLTMDDMSYALVTAMYDAPFNEIYFRPGCRPPNYKSKEYPLVPIFKAVADAYNLAALKILIQYGGDIQLSQEQSKMNLLHLSVDLEGVSGEDNEDGYEIEITQFLIEAGVNPFVKDRQGYTPLDLAIQYSHNEAAELLLKYMRNHPDKPKDWRS